MFVAECWEKCLKNPNSLIPAEKIKIESDDKVNIDYLTTLKYFKEKWQEYIQFHASTEFNKTEESLVEINTTSTQEHVKFNTTTDVDNNEIEEIEKSSLVNTAFCMSWS